VTSKAKIAVVFIFASALCISAASASDAYSIKKLSEALVALAPDVDPGEAEQLSVTAHTTARSLARQYHIVLNPEFQCFLINIGLRKRGYRGHWAPDIGQLPKRPARNYENAQIAISLKGAT